MRKLVEAAVKRIVKVHDQWFRFVQTDELLLALVQVRAAVAVLHLEDMFEGRVEIKDKEIAIRDLVHETFEKLENELLKRVGAEVTEDDAVVLASYEDDEAGVETSRRDYPPIALQWKGKDEFKITIYKEVD